MEQSSEQNMMSLREDMKVLGEYLQEIAQQMKEHNISRYPVFIAHKETAIQLGKPVIDAERSKTNWSFNASMLEELVGKQIVEKEKVLEFREVYNNPKEIACIFLVTPEQMDFVWCPYNLEEA